MIGQDMAAALAAIFAMTGVRFPERCTVVATLGYLHVIALPQRKGIHRAGAPVPAVLAMTIAHCKRGTCRGDFDSPAKTGSLVLIVA
jgi:hypothetical protein